jgi:hypothetical protein
MDTFQSAFKLKYKGNQCAINGASSNEHQRLFDMFESNSRFFN